MTKSSRRVRGCGTTAIAVALALIGLTAALMWPFPVSDGHPSGLVGTWKGEGVPFEMRSSSEDNEFQVVLILAPDGSSHEEIWRAGRLERTLSGSWVVEGGRLRVTFIDPTLDDVQMEPPARMSVPVYWGLSQGTYIDGGGHGDAGIALHKTSSEVSR